MGLGSSTPLSGRATSRFNLVTAAGLNAFRKLPFGGAVGIVVAGGILWLAPQLVPDGWPAEAVLSLGMGSGVVLSRLFDAMLGWFFEPIRRHLGSGWEAVLELRKLDHYRKLGMLPEEKADALTGEIVQEDITAKKRASR
jgi:hypothetical protein